MSDPMAEIRASFFIECEELLESLQDGLQLMDDGDTDSETINIVFRAVHSIKGGAGAFGLDDLVRFAHRFETAMDEVRAGRFHPDGEACSRRRVDCTRTADGSCQRTASSSLLSDIISFFSAFRRATKALPSRHFITGLYLLPANIGVFAR